MRGECGNDQGIRLRVHGMFAESHDIIPQGLKPALILRR
jgi:hypothetical protein